MTSGKEFPLGGLEIIQGNRVHLPLNFKDLLGIVKCRIVPPSGDKELYFPILPARHPDGHLMFPSCFACMVTNDHKRSCHHDEDERGWIATFFSEELRLAVDNGFIIKGRRGVIHFKM